MANIDVTQDLFVNSDVVAAVQATGSQDTITVFENVTIQTQAAGLAILADGFGDTLNLNGTADSLEDDAIVMGTSGLKASGGNTVGIAATGRITTHGSDDDALVLHGDGNTLKNAGTISAGRDGVLADGAFANLTNTNTIVAGGDAIHVTDDNATVVNNGYASGAIAGIAIEGNHASVTNTGLVLGSAGAGLALTSEGATIHNLGTIAGNVGVALVNDDGNPGTPAAKATLANDGLISAGAFGVYTVGNDVLVKNGANGTITLALGGDAVHMATVAGQTETFLNDGVVSSKLNAVTGGDGIEKVTNTGTMTGAVHLGGGNDVFSSAIGKVTGLIDGGDGNDTITGSAYADTILGGKGNDTLKGGGGADKITGGTGLDHLYGGTGADTFVFKATIESPATANRDVIEDFSVAQGDRVDIAGIDADTSVAGNQAFHFIGTAAFGHHAGELRYEAAGTGVVVSGDINGDGKADFSVELAHLASADAGMFIL